MEKYEDIKVTVNNWFGGYELLESRAENVKCIDNPILIIGIGGTGKDATLRLKSQIERTFNEESKSRIDYICFDNDKAETTYENVRLEEDEFMQLSSNSFRSTIMHRNLLEENYPEIASWFDKRIDITKIPNLEDGASGIRQLGRLFVFTRINKIYETLERKITDVTKGNNNPLIVYFMTGVSGGTGGGGAIDIAFILRDVLQKMAGGKLSSSKDTRVDGYLFMPDVNIANIGASNESGIAKNIQYNSYAFLKELDFFMNYNRYRQPYEVDYGFGKKISIDNTPFNSCNIISSTNSDGVTIKDAYNNCLIAVANTITNVITVEKDSDEFGTFSYESNAQQNRRVVLDQIDENRKYNRNYAYNTIGSATYGISTDEIVTYYAHRLGSILKEDKNKAINEKEIIGILKVSNIFKIETYLKKMLTDLIIKDIRPSAFDKHKNSAQLLEELSKTKSSNKKNLTRLGNERLSVVNRGFDSIYDALIKQLDLIATDKSKGFFYLEKVVNDDAVGLIVLINKKIKNISAKTNTLRKTLDAINKDIHSLENELNKKGFFKSTKKIYEEIVQLVDESYQASKTIEANEASVRVLEKLNNIFINNISENFEKYVSYYNETMLKIDKIHSDLLVEESGKHHFKRIISYPDLVKYIELQETINSEIPNIERDAEDVKAKFYARLWNNEVKKRLLQPSTAYDAFNIKTFLEMFLSKEELINKLLHQNIDFFIRANCQVNEQDESKMFDAMIDDLAKSSSVLVNYANLSSDKDNLYDLISIPKDSIKVAELSQDKYAKLNLRESDLKDRISLSKLFYFFPLCEVPEMFKAEELYELSLDQQNAYGRHLLPEYRNFPPLLTRKSLIEHASANEYRGRIEQYENRMVEVFQKAVSTKVEVNEKTYEIKAINLDVVGENDFEVTIYPKMLKTALDVINKYQAEKIAYPFEEIQLDRKLLEEISLVLSDTQSSYKDELKTTVFEDLEYDNREYRLTKLESYPDFLEYEHPEHVQYFVEHMPLNTLVEKQVSIVEKLVNACNKIEELYKAYVSKRENIEKYIDFLAKGFIRFDENRGEYFLKISDEREVSLLKKTMDISQELFSKLESYDILVIDAINGLRRNDRFEFDEYYDKTGFEKSNAELKDVYLKMKKKYEYSYRDYQDFVESDESKRFEQDILLKNQVFFETAIAILEQKVS